MRFPLMNVRYATDRFNWIRRLNDRARVARLNRDGVKTNWFDHHLPWWRMRRFCEPCKPEIVETRLVNRNPLRIIFKKTNCRPVKK